jgi:NAD(P)H-quinone oxidoreductase subunit 4
MRNRLFGNNCELPDQAKFEDATFREVMIAACFLALIVGLGFIPSWRPRCMT